MIKETGKAVKSGQKNSTTLSNTTVLESARSRLEEFLPLTAEGYACTTEQLLDVLLAVCTGQDTLEQVCADLHIKVGAATLRGYLNEQLTVENLPQLQQAVNAALQAKLRDSLKGQKLDVARDFQDQSYYGKSAQSEGLWVGAEAKNGTTKVYRVATLYVIKKGPRVTLASKFVRPQETAKESLEYLLKHLPSLEREAQCLYLERGFGCIEVARYLKESKQTAVVACPLRGTNGGLRALCAGRTSYRAKHIFKSDKHGAEEVAMALYKAFITTRKKGKKVRRVKWLAYMLINCDERLGVKKVKQNYRKRFGIEASYRCARKVRGWTTSANAGYRFLLLGLSFVVLNIWQELQAEWTRKAQAGRASWNWGKFRLKRFLNFLRKAIEDVYGLVLSIEMRN